MSKIYEVMGTLCKDFVGQISYTVALPKRYDRLKIGFEFEKQRYTPEDLTDEVVSKIVAELSQYEELDLAQFEDPKGEILSQAKTELQTLAMLNDEFIGCIHRQMTEREMVFTKDDATKGCLPVEKIEGVLKVTILAFNVLMDETPYKLYVEVE